MMIEGWGVAVDRVIADFVQGTVEWLVRGGRAPRRLGHRRGPGLPRPPAYCIVTLGLIHGTTPHAMVMVHKPGHGRPRLRPPAGAPLPDRVAARLHPTPRGGRGAGRAIEGRRRRAQHVAHRGRGRGPPGRRGDRGRDRAADRRPVRFGGDALWQGIETAVDALPWVVAGGDARQARDPLAAPAYPGAAAPRPVRDRARVARRGQRWSRPSSRSCATMRTAPPAPSGSARATRTAYYGETPETMAAVVPLLLDALVPIEPDLRGLGGDVRAALEDAEGLMTAAIGHHGATSARSTSRSTTSSASGSGLPVRELLGLPGEVPPTDFTLGIDEPAVVAERARRAADFPALKIKLGGPADLATLEAVRAVYAGPIRVDANTGWTPEGAVALLPDLVRLGRRAHRAAVPGPPPRPAALAPGALRAADRGRRERGDDRGPRRRSWGSSRASTSSSPSAAASGPARRMLERARELGFRTFLGCMEETSVGIAASAAVVARSRTGSTSTAACCSPTTPSSGLETSAPTSAGGWPTGRVSAWSCGPGRGPDGPVPDAR